MLGEPEKSSDVWRTESLSEMGHEQIAATSSAVTDQRRKRTMLTVSAITSGGPTDTKFYYQWRSNFSLKTFTRGRKQYAHYETPEKYVN